MMTRTKAAEVLGALFDKKSTSKDECEAIILARRLLERVGDDEIITSVSRDDIMGILDADDKSIYGARVITQGDLKEIADKMADAYCENGFWIDLPIICENVLGKVDPDTAFSRVNADER